MIEKSVHLLKNAHGHLFLFPNIFLVFKYFYRASSEKKSPWASSEEKSPWASFSILKYFTAFKYFYRVFQKKETIGFFFYSQIFYQYSSIFTGRLQKKRAHAWASFYIAKKTQKTLKDAGLIKNMT